MPIKNCRRYFVVSLLILISVFSGQSCKSSQRNHDTLVIGAEKAALTLDPRIATDFYSMRACRLIYDGLFKLNDAMQPVENLIERYTTDATHTVYDLWLRPGIKFHDGSELTIKDVTATYDFIMDPANKSTYRNSFEKVAKFETVSPQQLRITLKEPYNPFLYALTMGIVPARFKESKPFVPIGSGPFRVENDLGADGLRLAANNNYFGGKPGVPKVFIKPVLEDNVRLLELLNGSIDLLQNSIPPTLLERAESHAGISVAKTPGLAYAYLGINFNDPQLKKLPVRQAIAHAIDRDEIIKFKLRGLAVPADTILASTHFMHAANLPTIPFDPQKAKDLLDQAGLKDPDGEGPQPRLQLTYKTSNNPERLEIAQVIVEQLRKVGIAVELKSLEFGVFFDDIKQGNFQLFGLEWSGITSEDIYYYAFHSASVPPDGANRGRYANAEVDRLTTLSRTEPEMQKRQALSAQIQKILADEVAYVSLWYRMNVVATSKRVQGYSAAPVADYQHLLQTTLTSNEGK